MNEMRFERAAHEAPLGITCFCLTGPVVGAMKLPRRIRLKAAAVCIPVYGHTFGSAGAGLHGPEVRYCTPKDRIAELRPGDLLLVCGRAAAAKKPMPVFDSCLLGAALQKLFEWPGPSG